MKILKLDKGQFDSDGLVSLFRGDDWSIDAKVITREGNIEKDFDLTDYSAKAYFPNTDPTLDDVEISCTIVSAPCGKIKIELTKAQSLTVGLAPQGISFYIILSDTNSKTTTVETEFEPLGVKDHGYRGF